MILYRIGKYSINKNKHNFTIMDTKTSPDGIIGYYSRLSHALNDLVEILAVDKKSNSSVVALVDCINEAGEDILNAIKETTSANIN